jgi:hypothetical protein
MIFSHTSSHASPPSHRHNLLSAALPLAAINSVVQYRKSISKYQTLRNTYSVCYQETGRILYTSQHLYHVKLLNTHTWHGTKRTHQTFRKNFAIVNKIVYFTQLEMQRKTATFHKISAIVKHISQYFTVHSTSTIIHSSSPNVMCVYAYVYMYMYVCIYVCMRVHT